MIEPDVRRHSETGELFGVYCCPNKDDIGPITVDLERRRRWELVCIKPKRRTSRDKKVATKAPQAETAFKKWDRPGACCFVIEEARIKFWDGDDFKDLRLKSNSRTHTLLTLLSAGQLSKAEIKKGICSKKTAPSEAVRDVNRTLNDKMKKLNVQNVPANVEFVSRDERNEQYYSVLPIKTSQEFDMS